MSLARIDALDLTGVRVEVAVDEDEIGSGSAYAVNVRVFHPDSAPGDVEVGAWAYVSATDAWGDTLPHVYGDSAHVSESWTFPYAERVLAAYWRGEDVDTRPMAS